MATANYKIASITDALNDFAGRYVNGVIEIRTGSLATTAENAATGTLLGYVTLEGAAFVAGTATNGINFAAASGVELPKAVAENWKFIGVADGVAGYARHFNNAKTKWFDVDISGTTGTAAMKLSNLNITAGSVNVVQSYKLAN
jgi:hypothetical protein